MMGRIAVDLPEITWYIAVLVFLEGVLSADNALVLALMVRRLPRHDRRRVLQWGIWGAIGFRVVAVALSAFLLKFWPFKVGGGGYLLYLAISHFWSRGHSTAGMEQPQESKVSRLVSWILGDRGARHPHGHCVLDRFNRHRSRHRPTVSPLALVTRGST